MKVTFHCPACSQPHRVVLQREDPRLQCATCGFVRQVPVEEISDDKPERCVGCGNDDLWRQKDFPQQIGFLMVVLGAVLSSIAWAYHYPVLAMSILAGFALLDMLCYWLMPDVLVCYRCRAKHHVGVAAEGHAAYDHELGERYRQEKLRMESSPPII